MLKRVQDEPENMDGTVKHIGKTSPERREQAYYRSIDRLQNSYQPRNPSKLDLKEE